MATLYVRNFPDELYETVQAIAGEDRQTIGAEVIDLMTEAITRVQRKRNRLAALDRIKQRRIHFRPTGDGKDSLALLREDRER